MALPSLKLTGKKSVTAMIPHMGVILLSWLPFANLLPASLLWYRFRYSDDFTRQNALEALNFNIFYTVLYVVAVTVTGGPHETLPRLVELYMFIGAAIAMFRCGREREFRYPFVVRTIR
jgi:uncharacterized Tic20 family protein